ncbi:hypothetical protein [Halolamina rubra]|uniref:hypothetical protein n=1 Tax=Halolamina rubra TaxID=1380430 RepID=UPI0006787522|nr:hypothetical protein [Halolamina rubra]
MAAADDAGAADPVAAAADAEAEALLDQYTERWSVANDLAESSTVRSHEEWDAIKEIERTLTVTESTRTVSVPPSDAPSRGSVVPIDERYEHAPEAFEATTVEFADFDGARLVGCTDCGGSGREACGTCDRRTVVNCDECRGDGTADCGACAGQGAVDCADCNGTGSRGDAACSRCNGTGELACRTCNATGERQCPKCDGAGEVTCPDCAGQGDVPCSTCTGAGELYETTRGTLEYEPESTFAVDDPRGADEAWFADVDGDRFDMTVRSTPDRASDGGPTTVAHEVEQRSVPVSKVSYEYGGEAYDLYQVGRNLHSHSVPKSTTRRLLPVVAVLVVAALGGYYYFAVL